MTAIPIGPFVLDGARLAALAAILLFSLVAGAVGRMRRRHGPEAAGDAGTWATAAILAWALGARAGFVIANAGDFAARPLDALKLWQGGFAPLAGWIAGAAVLAMAVLRDRKPAVRALAAGAVAAFLAHEAATAVLLPPEMRLPALDLIALDGSTVQLAVRDRPLVLNLWATWCPPCRREMPMLTDMAATLSEVDFVFANQGETEGQIRTFLLREGLPADGMIRDPNQRLMAELAAIGLPGTLVFDAEGRLVAAQTGEVSRAVLGRMIAKAKDD